MNSCFRIEHGEIPRHRQSPVAGLATERASRPHGIHGRPASDLSVVLPDLEADPHVVSVGQFQRLGRDLVALAELHSGAGAGDTWAMWPAVHPGDDVIDRGAARGVLQVIPVPRAAPVLRLHQLGLTPGCVKPTARPHRRTPPHHPSRQRTATGRTSPSRPPAARTRRTSPPPRTCVYLTVRSDIAAVAGGSEKDLAAAARSSDLLLPIPR